VQVVVVIGEKAYRYGGEEPLLLVQLPLVVTDRAVLIPDTSGLYGRARSCGELRGRVSRAALHIALARRSFELPETEGTVCRALAAFDRFQAAAFNLRREAWRGFVKLGGASAEVAVEPVTAKVAFEQEGAWFSLTETAETPLGTLARFRSALMEQVLPPTLYIPPAGAEEALLQLPETALAALRRIEEGKRGKEGEDAKRERAATLEAFLGGGDGVLG
jgi:hypothetical protein